jgi:hypothetical protein
MLPNEKRKDLLKTALNQIINVKLISLTRQIDELMNEVNVLKMKKDELRKL